MANNIKNVKTRIKHKDTAKTISDAIPYYEDVGILFYRHGKGS
jgi:hypothetical protein